MCVVCVPDYVSFIIMAIDIVTDVHVRCAVVESAVESCSVLFLCLLSAVCFESSLLYILI